MNRFLRRVSIATSGLAVCGLVAAALTGCGSGQLSQTAAMEPAVNGSSATVKHIALRDVRISAIQTTDALRPGKTVDLVFVAANQSADVNDTLLGITSDVGQVDITGPKEIPAGAALIVGAAPHQEAAPLGATGAAKATVKLAKSISNGLTYDFTFRFAQAGETTVTVPISAGDEAPRFGRESGGGAAEEGEH